MATTVTIRCPQGIQRLCELGESVARSGNWNASNAKEALIGLWLSTQLCRAELRGALEVVGDRVQADLSPLVPVSEQLAEQALTASWAQAETEAQAMGGTLTDTTTIDVSLPGEAGALPLAGVIAVSAAVVVATGSAAWIVHEIGPIADRITARVAEWKQRAQHIEEEIVIVTGHFEVQKVVAAKGGDPNSVQYAEVERQKLRDNAEADLIALKQNAPKDNTGGGLFDGLSTPIGLGIAAAVALYFFMPRGK